MGRILRRLQPLKRGNSGCFLSTLFHVNGRPSVSVSFLLVRRRWCLCGEEINKSIYRAVLKRPHMILLLQDVRLLSWRAGDGADEGGLFKNLQLKLLLLFFFFPSERSGCWENASEGIFLYQHSHHAALKHTCAPILPAVPESAQAHSSVQGKPRAELRVAAYSILTRWDRRLHPLPSSSPICHIATEAFILTCFFLFGFFGGVNSNFLVQLPVLRSLDHRGLPCLFPLLWI